MNENTLTLNNEKYKSEQAAITTLLFDGVSYPSCRGCAFYEKLLLCDEAKTKISCIAAYRTDNCNIIWIEEK